MFDTVDAALYYPRDQYIYFFKGEHYLTYRFNEGVVLQNGRELMRIGIDGWRSFPDDFRRDIDAALFYQANGHAYFFKGDKYIKFLPGSGVVALDSGEPIRTIGTTGWGGFPEEFRQGLDAALDYPPSGKCYFFRGRDYLRWKPDTGVEELYPRRLGLLNRDHGGWPGLSHVVAGPMVGPVTDWRAKIWIWMTDTASADGLQILLNGSSVRFTTENPVESQIADAVDGINAGSQIRVLTLTNLSPATNYEARIMLGDVELDTVTFKTAPPRVLTGRVKIAFGSCADMSKRDSYDVPAFEGMNSVQPDLALLCGDNCYYVNANRNTFLTGDRPHDWESTERMLRRQVEARNHPQFTSLSRSTPFYSTWDDHDFGFNNADGVDRTTSWVGRSAATAVFRAMWPNPYGVLGTDRPIHYSFRWGPVEVFMTDSRFHRDGANQVVWGQDQVDWLVDRLTSSDAPLKIVVVACQFLFMRPGAGHLLEAPGERETVRNKVLDGSITGRVLFLSGDRHYSEVMREPPGTGPATTLEFTSSPLRRRNEDIEAEEVAGSRVWVVQRNGFGVVNVDIQSIDLAGTGAVEGTVMLEAREAFRDGNGRISSRVIREGNQVCRSTWNLASGLLT